MAVRVAIADGNWSSTSTWEDGIVPTSSDDVYFVGKNVVVNQNITVKSLRSTWVAPDGWVPFTTTLYQMLPSSVIPVMTSNSTPTGTGSVISSTSSTGAYNSFNRDHLTGTGWSGGIGSGWLGFYFDTTKIIKRYAFRNYSSPNNTPYSWTFEGSNDGTTWTVLDTVSNLAQSANTFYVSSILANTTAYNRYRINVSAMQVAGNTLVIPEFEMTESVNPAYCTTTLWITDGTLTLPAGYTINATVDIQGYRQAAGSFILYTAASPGTATINTPFIYGGAAGSSYALNHSGTGTLNINGSISGYIYGSSGQGSVLVSGTGTLNVVGNITTAYNSSANSHGLQISSSCTVNITGDIIYQTSTGGRIGLYITAGSPNVTISGSVYAISPAASSTAPIQIVSSATPIVNIIGNVNSNLCTAIYVANGGLTTLNITGNLIASSSTACINNAGNYGVIVNHTGLITSSGSCAVFLYNNAASVVTTNVTSLVNASNGVMLIIAWKIFFTAATNRTWTFRAEDGTTAINMYTSDLISSSGQPAVSDVRLGTSYGAGAYTGTCAVPSPLSVAYPVPVDNITGVAVLTPNSVGAAIWDRLASLLTTSGSIGERLKNTATVQTTGAQISGFDI